MKPSRIVVASFLALLLMASGAAAQSPEPGPEPGPEADLSLKSQSQPTGVLVGETFQLVYTVANHGPENATEASFSQYLPPELEFVGANSSDASDECAIGYPPSDYGDPPPPEQGAPPSGGGGSGGTVRSSGGYYGDSMYCTLGTLENGHSATITLSLRRIGAREIYTSAYVGSAMNDSIYDNNYVDLQLEADKSRPADIGVTMDSPKTPDVGADFTYKILVTNQGPSTADSVTVVNPLGYGLSFVSATTPGATDSCEMHDFSDPDSVSPSYGGYSEVACELKSLAVGQTVEVQVTVNRASAYEIWNNAWVVTSNYDENYENDYAYFTIPADPSVTSDLAVKMTGPATTPLVGDQFDLTITVSNFGPAVSGDTWLSDYLPPDLEFVSASPTDTCSFNDYGPYPMADAPSSAPSAEKGDAYYPISPGGLFCSLGSIASGESSSVTVTVKRKNAREIWNSAWVSSSNYDPNYENNYSDLVLDPDKSKPADIGVTMDAPAKPDVGSDFTFSIAVTNNGPSQADNVFMTDYVPYGTDFKAVTSSDGSDTCTYNDQDYYDDQPESLRPSFIGLREVVCELGSMASGETTNVTIEVTRVSEYEIWNSAWATTSNYDENYENDYASVLVEGEPYPGACTQQGDATGTGKSDEIVIGDCYAETKAGADTVEVIPPSAGNSRVDSGRGPDTVNVNLSVGGRTRRMIDIATGRGNDLIRINVSPGAGNATIFVDGGRGNDLFEIDVPAGITGLRIVIRGRGGKDTVTWAGQRSSTGGTYPGLIVRAGDGSDLLQGGYGNDHLRGGRGGDRLYGSLGDDVLRGGSGYDICRGGPGNNVSLGC